MVAARLRWGGNVIAWPTARKRYEKRKERRQGEKNVFPLAPFFPPFLCACKEMGPPEATSRCKLEKETQKKDWQNVLARGATGSRKLEKEKQKTHSKK